LVHPLLLARRKPKAATGLRVDHGAFHFLGFELATGMFMNALIPIFVVRDALQSTELGNTALTNPPEDRSFAEIAVASFILGVKNTPTPAFDF
jgi:hypothetical protein